MPWWGWVVAGLVLALMEFVTPGGFIVIFFAVGAVLVGVLVALSPLPDWLQWALFTALSVVSLFLFRGKLQARFSPEPQAQEMGDLIGGMALAGEDLAPGAFGRGEFRGAQWTLKNVDSRVLAKGERCRIESTDGLTLMVKAEGGS